MSTTRRSKSEICSELKSKRRKYYSIRSNALKALKNPNLTEKQKEKKSKTYNNASNRISALNVKLFRCGKKYQILNRERQRLQNLVNRTRRELRNVNLSKGERDRLTKKFREYSIELNMAKKAMGMDIVETRTGELKMSYDAQTMIGSELITVYKAPEAIRDLMESKDYDNVDIMGEMMSIDLQFSDILIAVDDFCDEITNKQFSTNTPILKIYTDPANRLIRITNETI